MAHRQPEPAGGAEQGFRGDLRLGEVAGQHHGHVEAPVEQPLLDVHALLLVQVQLQLRIRLRQSLQVVRQEVAHHRVAGGDVHAAADVGVRQRAVQRVVDAAQDRVGVVEEVPAVVGQHHALRRAGEQGGAEQAFQFLDGAGHGRLRDVQVDRRLGNLPDLGRGDEVADLAQGECHGRTPAGIDFSETGISNNKSTQYQHADLTSFPTTSTTNTSEARGR
ncbi:hypothetical protein D9M69_526790 [compost metagenome]